MKICSFGIYFFCLTYTLAAQDITELDKKNGFKDIKLGMPIDSVKGIKLKKEFKEKNGAEAKLYSITHPDYKSIGEIQVNQIEAKVYKGFIYEIHVFTEKDPRLIKAMESILGQAAYDQINERYLWKGQNLNLTYQPHGKKEFMLVYLSHLVYKMMKDDKDKKVEDISTDF